MELYCSDSVCLTTLTLRRCNMKRIIILLIVLLAALSVSAVSAEDNLTDVVAEDIDAEPVATCICLFF